jgi:acetoacetyl-CoA synthetase
VRFGSGEIYAIVETAPFTDEISDTLCVGRRRPRDRDEEVFLFVVMKPGKTLTRNLIMSVKKAIGKALSPRHVPRFILEVPEIPVTINGKKVEAAVKQTISGKDVKPSNTVTNPDSIGYFARFRDIERELGQAKL